jgi:hypothetical protein
VGTAGLNNVLNMLPARDEQEYSLLPAEDIAFVKGWMDWTDRHVAWIRNTKTITGVSANGVLDAVAMIYADQGAMFVFNPTSFAKTLSVTLDKSLGFSDGCAGTLVVRATGSSNRAFKPFNLEAAIACGANLNVTVPATTALSFEFTPTSTGNGTGSDGLVVIGGAATAMVDWASSTLALTDSQGPAGEDAVLTITFPASGGSPSDVRFITINGGSPITIATSPDCTSLDTTKLCVESFTSHGVRALRVRGRWTGESFQNEIGTMDGFMGGAWSGDFTVLPAAMAQLAALNESYPIVYDLDPEGNNDANVPWLAPGRLLMFVKYRPLLNDTLNASGSIDGKPIIMRKAYNTIARSPGRFIGYWADATEHITPGEKQTLSLTLPDSSDSYVAHNAYIYEGNDLGVANVTIEEAEKHCSSLGGVCEGFTFGKPPAMTQCSNASGIQQVTYKSSVSGRSSNTNCTLTKPAAPVGVFFENVQPLTGSFVPRSAFH